MNPVHSVKKLFATTAAGLVLAVSLGLEPAMAQTQEPNAATQDSASPAQQSEKIAVFFETVNGQKIQLKNRQLTEEQEEQENKFYRQLDRHFAQLRKNPALVDDRIFTAWEQMTRHWNQATKYTALRNVSIFNAKKEYAQYLLENPMKKWALSHDRDPSWAIQNTIWHVAQNFPDLLPLAVNIIEKQVRSHDSEVRENGINNIESIGRHHAASRADMLWLLEDMGDDNSTRVRWVALYTIEQLLDESKASELDQSLMDHLFDMAAKEQDPANTSMALDVAITVVLKAPDKMTARLMNLAAATITRMDDIRDKDKENAREVIQTMESALRAITIAGEKNPKLFDMAYYGVSLYLHDKWSSLQESAVSLLSNMAVASGKREDETFALMVPFLQAEGDVKVTALQALAKLGERHEKYANAPFEEAKQRIHRGNHRHMRARATGILGALGAAHESLREEAFTLVMGVAMTQKEDSTVQGVAMDGLASIAAADEKYADRIFAWAKEPATRKNRFESYVASSVTGGIGIKNCDRFDEAKRILQEQFDAALKVRGQKNGGDVETCRGRQRENPRHSNLPGILGFSADDHSFE